MIYFSEPQLVCFGDNVEELFHRFRRLTSDDLSASNLVLAHVQSQQGEPEILDTVEVSKRLGVSKAQVQTLARTGQLRHVRVGRLMKFRPEYVDEFLKPASSPGRHW